MIRRVPVTVRLALLALLLLLLALLVHGGPVEEPAGALSIGSAY